LIGLEEDQNPYPLPRSSALTNFINKCPLSSGAAADGGNVLHGFPVAAVEREGDAHLLAIVAAVLQCVGAPARVAPVHGDLAIVAPLLALAAVGLEQQAMELHDAVDALRIGRCAPGLPGLAA